MVSAKDPQIIILLPAYNEEPSIAPLFGKIRAALQGVPYKILFIDDGSTDGTLNEVRRESERMPVQIIERGRNGGLGVALSQGLEVALSSFDDSDILVTMDADNTFTPDLILPMVKKNQTGADIVIASRYAPGALVVGVPIARRGFSAFLSYFLRGLFPAKGVRDYSSGYRCYRLSLIRRLWESFQVPLRAKGFPVMMELLLKAIALGANCREVPVQLRYDLKGNKSKLKFLRACIEYAKIFWFTFRDIQASRNAEEEKHLISLEHK